MRLLRLTTNYPAYLDLFYSRHPELAAQTYAVQHAELMHDCFGWSDFWSESLKRLGYEVAEIVANAEPLQKRWANEQRFDFKEDDWKLAIAAAQVKAFRPDVLFVNDYHSFGADFLRQLKSECPSIRLTLGWCGAPYSDSSVFNEYDIVLSCIPELVDHFHSQGHTCYHLNHAFDPRVLERINRSAPPSVDFSFIGSIVREKNFHGQREQLLLELTKETNLQIWSNLPPTEAPVRAVKARRLAYDSLKVARSVGVPQSFLQVIPVIGKAALWENRPASDHDFYHRIFRRTHPGVFGLAMFQQLHESKVALNTHIDISPTNASNMRLFEATGIGTCLLTDWRVNLSSLFEPDLEIITYRNSEECIEKVRYLLDHEDERRRIAGAGQRRTLRDHTFDRRAEILNNIIRSELAQ